MPISNKEELEDAASIASEKLQDIQDYLGRNDNPTGQVKFPHGYLSATSNFRSEFPFFDDKAKSNLAHARMLNDVYWWLLHRTNISSIARDMTIKAAIYNWPPLSKRY